LSNSLTWREYGTLQTWSTIIPTNIISVYPKTVIESRKSEKDRQCNGQQKKRQRNKQWSTKHHTENKDWTTRTPGKSRVIKPTWVCEFENNDGHSNFISCSYLKNLRYLHYFNIKNKQIKPIKCPISFILFTNATDVLVYIYHIFTEFLENLFKIRQTWLFGWFHFYERCRRYWSILPHILTSF
jgi:hypothetical protein